MARLISVSARGEVNQADLARVIPLTTRQIRNLEREGIPHRAEGNRKLYPLTEAVVWWKDREVKKGLKAANLSELDAARTRKLDVEATQKELELAVRRGELVHVDVMRRKLAAVFSRVRARLIAMKGALPPRITGLDTPREALAIVGPEVDRVLGELLEVTQPGADQDDS